MPKPQCPRCDHRLRVKPVPRTVKIQMWQCPNCLKTLPPRECEWTNVSLQLALEDKENR